MTTLSNLLQTISTLYNECLEVVYYHPSLYVFCIDENFANLDSETRIVNFLKKTNLSQTDLDEVISHGMVQLVLATPLERAEDYSFVGSTDSGEHWLAWYSRLTTRNFTKKASSLPSSSSSRALHFYGFKGGQARSTVLVLMAKCLADDGANVLVVDADIEAPSLDTLFDVAAETPDATLMGLCGWASSISPLSKVYSGRGGLGAIDLLACRPRSESYDMDFARFLLGTALDSRTLQKAASDLKRYSENKNRYDFVLFDHRTGLAPSVLPIMEGWPGPAIIFVRPDGMSRNIENSGAVRALLSYDIESPGAFLTFSLDPKETRDVVLERHGKFVERLLETLSDVLTSNSSLESNDIDPLELDRYWLLWHHDSAVLAQAAAAPNQISANNQKALQQLREVLDLNVNHAQPNAEPISLTKSGATDQGMFILTPDFARLLSRESTILYIFGRKGTGKTRLLRELHQRELGTPLLVAQDFTEGGVQSAGPIFSALLDSCHGSFDLFWWALLNAGIDSQNQKCDISKIIKDKSTFSKKEWEHYGKISVVENNALASKNNASKHVFLIDGVETAVPAARLREFVESLFRFLATVQYTKSISNALTIRLFLRSDLYKSASQNIEQQTEGHSINLRWDRESILNFAVARIASLDWFGREFPGVCKKIDSKIPLLSKGALPESDAESLLLEIFPKGLERNKTKTTTFFATYFSDAGGDSESKASFYPRLFDGFLREMNNQAKKISKDQTIMSDGHLRSSFVLKAYDAASAAFIDEVRTELHNLLDLVSGDGPNRDAVNKLLEAFSGLSTPFIVEEIIVSLEKRSQLGGGKIREALGKMKQLGIFEDRPGYPGAWRTGRLYKSGLAMKYVRSGLAHS